jgi:hypothetical protein
MSASVKKPLKLCASHGVSLRLTGTRSRIETGTTKKHAVYSPPSNNLLRISAVPGKLQAPIDNIDDYWTPAE